MSASVLVCTDLVAGVCESQGWQAAYLIAPEHEGVIGLFLTGGFSQEAAGIGFGEADCLAVGAMVVAAVAAMVVVGVVIAMVRKI